MRRTTWLPWLAAGALACSDAKPATTREVTPQTATPVLSPPPGTYTSARSVTITSATAGATVHCTDDGSTPTAASPACPASVSVTATTTLRAMATAPGHLDSDVAGGTYTIQADATRAATPTFSPPGGSYTATQSVTISSTTSGAVIHCTTDGTTATAASPTCSGPIAVAATTTIRAVATATGFTASAEARATYIIGGALSDLDCALALSTSRQFLGHQSVGNYLLYVGNGLDAQLKALHAGTTIRRVEGATAAATAAAASLAPGDWLEWEIPENGNPDLKLDNFRAVAQAGFPAHLDFAALKFCFVDVTEDTDVAARWAHYQSVMDPLEAAYPGRVVFWTVPLTAADPTGADASNAAREALSGHIRTKYGPTGRVFDFADLEAHDAAGHLVTDRNGVRTMSADWAGPGGDPHPGAAGTEKLARDYLHFMCGVRRAR